MQKFKVSIYDVIIVLVIATIIVFLFRIFFVAITKLSFWIAIVVILVAVIAVKIWKKKKTQE